MPDLPPGLAPGSLPADVGESPLSRTGRKVPGVCRRRSQKATRRQPGGWTAWAGEEDSDANCRGWGTRWAAAAFAGGDGGDGGDGGPELRWW